VEDKVLFDKRGHVGVFTFNRPAQANAIDPDVTRAMNDLVATFEQDDQLRVGVVTGAGGRAFCAGADLKAIAAGRLGEIVDVEPYGFAGLIRGNRHKPLVAAVEGAALAGGFEVAIACDLIVAGDTARFGLPEVRRGIIAGAGGLQRLPRLIPPLRALELILTGRDLGVAEAGELGLVNEIVPAGTALRRALELAEAIAANAPVAVCESRAVARKAIEATEADAWQRVDEAWRRVLATADAQEGPRAFAERRNPVWRGSGRHDHLSVRPPPRGSDRR
jgi:enoyl-CoA hydratase/carnithine racemase